MATLTPPHVTVVYPEETIDEAVLLAAVADTASETPPFELYLRAVLADDDGDGGVFVEVQDPAGALETVRDRLLLPPQRHSGFPFHTTIAHPRTSLDPRGCWRELQGQRLDRSVSVEELLHTVTDNRGRRVLSRHPLRGDGAVRRTVYAGAVVIAADRVLLGHRAAERAEYPDVWDLPGGHVEVDESPRAALARELREELSIDAVIGAPWRRLVDDALGAELSIWLVREWRGNIVNAAPDEHSELRWCGAAELSGLPLAHPSLHTLLLDALAGH